MANLKYLREQDNMKNSSPAAKPMLAQESAGPQYWHHPSIGRFVFPFLFVCVKEKRNDPLPKEMIVEIRSLLHRTGTIAAFFPFIKFDTSRPVPAEFAKKSPLHHRTDPRTSPRPINAQQVAIERRWKKKSRIYNHLPGFNSAALVGNVCSTAGRSSPRTK